MKSNIKLIVALLAGSIASSVSAESLRENTLKQAAKRNGLTPASSTHVAVPMALAKVGQLLFESRLLSPDNSISCATCHIDKFGSTDGLANAIGVGGKGLGEKRRLGKGRIVPRNTLPFWGRGGVGFDVFFWDGKVDARTTPYISQFGALRPSEDPLVVAVHLPPVELTEMVGETKRTEKLQTEEVKSAQILYAEAASRIANDRAIGAALAMAVGKKPGQLEFIDIATAIASFIRWNFEVQPTQFHQFVFANGEMTERQITGGLVFYGKGRCSACHNGAYFSDLDFHAIPSSTAGFGKNGFGVDYGRYNVNLAPKDRGKFRTPPLFNVTKTGPYMHSGSLADLRDAIVAHQDPLSVLTLIPQKPAQRMDFYRQLKVWSSEPVSEAVLTTKEIDDLVGFLSSLEYESKVRVNSGQ